MSFYEYGKTEEYLLSLIKGGAEPRLEELRKEAEDAGVPVLCETGAQLLKLITVMTAPTRILEIGTAAGYSGLVMLLNSGAKLYTIDFDGEVLTEALRKTFSNREHNFSLEQFKRVMSFADDAAMQKKWKAFVRKINTKTDDYSTVLRTIQNFLEQPFTAAVEEKAFIEKWSAADGEWI